MKQALNLIIVLVLPGSFAAVTLLGQEDEPFYLPNDISTPTQQDTANVLHQALAHVYSQLATDNRDSSDIEVSSFHF